MKKIYNLFFVITIFLSFIFILNVNAASSITVTSDENSKYTVTREVNKVTNPVTNTFKYKIEAAANNPASVTGAPTDLTINFNNASPDANKTVTSSVTLDFAGTTFTKVGDYKFKITEISSTDNESYPALNESWEINVSVRFKDDGTNKMIYTFVAPNKEGEQKVNNKTILFKSSTAFTYITIKNQVRGNMADQQEYFKIKVNIDCVTGDEYKIEYKGETIPDSTINYNDQEVTRSLSYSCGEDNYVYLKHNEVVTIGLSDNSGEIKNNTLYSFLELDATNYDTYINDSTTNSKDSGELFTVSAPITSGTSNVNGKNIKPIFLATTVDNNYNKIVNDYTAPTLTGIFLKIAPYVVIVVISTLLVIYLTYRNNKNKKELNLE